MAEREYTCEEISKGMKRAAGWLFADLFHNIFWNTVVILIGENADGEDLELRITKKWLEANHANKFGFTNELAAKFTAHVEICQDPLCQEAKKRIRAIGKHFASNTMPGGPAVVLAGTVDRFPGEYARHECRLGRKNGYGRRIDELKRFFKWFTDDRDFWVWPDEIASTEPTP